MSTPVFAENYHLKWNSHPLFMNMSLTSFLRNEKFTDVMLLTSNPEGGPGIRAHKVILTLCSSYFAYIFDINPQISGTTYIVLPPELSRRAIKILVQYMYCGEATVPNDILNEVLRGGEMLRIRGLCRNSNSLSYTRPHSSDSNSSHQYSSRILSDTGSSQMNSKINDREKQQQEPDTKSLPLKNPVIVRSSKPPPPQTHHQSASLINPLNVQTQNISVRKDVAIDPVDNCSSKYCTTSPNNCSTVFNKDPDHQQDHCSRTIYRNYSPVVGSSLSPNHDRVRANSEDICSYHPINSDLLESMKHSRDHDVQSRVYNRRASIPQCNKSFKNSKKSRNDVFITVQDKNREEGNHETKVPTIKQEPTDWSSDSRNSPNPKITTQTIPPLAAIKKESEHNGVDRNKDKEDEEDLSYSPLTCELCSATFTVPKDWVRHIEGHMNSSSQILQVLPKKKRKIPEESDKGLIATLKCDLCSTNFVTPAEWVRHIQNFHTETELAKCNIEHGSTSSLIKKQKTKRSNLQDMEFQPLLEKSCGICNKQFSSYASMVIHASTHHEGRNTKDSSPSSSDQIFSKT